MDVGLASLVWIITGALITIIVETRRASFGAKEDEILTRLKKRKDNILTAVSGKIIAMGPDPPAKDIENLLDKAMEKLTPIRMCLEALENYTKKFIHLLALLVAGALFLTIWLFDSDITIFGFDFFAIGAFIYIIGAIWMVELMKDTIKIKEKYYEVIK